MPPTAKLPRRQAILDAALPLFVERGVASTSIDDIRAASGASVGSIYHHFGSKENIAVALYVAAITAYQEELTSMIASARTTREGIEQIVDHFLSWVVSHPHHAHLMLDVGHAEFRALASEEVDRLNAHLFQKLKPWLASRTDSAALRDLEMDVLVAVVLGPARYFAGTWLSGRATTTMRVARSVLPQMAWSSLQGCAQPPGTAATPSHTG